MPRKNLVIAIYSPPEYYPPTLNAIECLSDEFEQLTVVFRNYSGVFDWNYPGNVALTPVGKRIDVREAEKSGLLKKTFLFLQYTIRLLIMIRRKKPDTILIYDYMPILSFRLIWPFIKNPGILWYHNHDVGDEEFLRKWSLSWLAWKSEKWIFPKLSVFSLPSLERKPFFPMEKFNGCFFFLPNFPGNKVFRRFGSVSKSSDSLISIVYQGSIGPLHGIEEIIGILDNKIQGKDLRLVLKGFVSDSYRTKLSTLAIDHGVNDKLVFLPPTSYSKVIENSMTCHIGIAIHMKQDIMNKTLATSSNKIYEYAASGLAVLLFDNNHFRKHLAKFSWTFFTDCSRSSLTLTLAEIVTNLDRLSASAKRDFADKLNFETYFAPISAFLNP